MESYRARALLEYLAASPKYACYHVDPRFYDSISGNFIARLFLKVLRVTDRIHDLIKLCISDIVFILPMSRLAGIEAKLAKLFNKKIIGEFYISKYDTWVNDRKAVGLASRYANRLLKIDQSFIDMCDVVIFLNASERAYYLKVTSREEAITKSRIIPLATGQKKMAAQRFANNKRDQVVLCWWGTFIPLHGLEKIIECAVYLKSANINFQLYLFGTSEEKSKPYRDQISKLGLSDYVIIDNSKSFSDKTLESFLVENCDIAFGNFGDSIKARTVMVNKVVESASMALPIVSQKTQALEEYFKNDESIFYTEPNAEKIAEKVIEMIQDKQKMLSVSKREFKLYEERFSRGAFIQDAIKVLDQV